MVWDYMRTSTFVLCPVALWICQRVGNIPVVFLKGRI